MPLRGHGKSKPGRQIFSRGLQPSPERFHWRVEVDDVSGSGPEGERAEGAHRVLASCSVSKVFCLFSSSIRVTVTSFSLGFDSAVVMGRVTPIYLERWVEVQHRMRATLSWQPLTVCRLAKPWFRGLQGGGGLKLQVFVEVQTQPTRGVCRHADTLDQSPLIQPKMYPQPSAFSPIRHQGGS